MKLSLDNNNITCHYCGGPQNHQGFQDMDFCLVIAKEKRQIPYWAWNPWLVVSLRASLAMDKSNIKGLIILVVKQYPPCHHCGGPQKYKGFQVMDCCLIMATGRKQITYWAWNPWPVVTLRTP